VKTVSIFEKRPTTFKKRLALPVEIGSPSSGEGSPEAMDEPDDLSSNLLLAAQEGDVDTVRSIAAAADDSGGAPSLLDGAVTEEGWRALDLACERGHAEVVSALLEHGADPQLSGPNGFTPLMWACRGGHLAVSASPRPHLRTRVQRPRQRRPPRRDVIYASYAAAHVRAHGMLRLVVRPLSQSPPFLAHSLRCRPAPTPAAPRPCQMRRSRGC
jgi:hypothetical protein